MTEVLRLFDDTPYRRLGENVVGLVFKHTVYDDFAEGIPLGYGEVVDFETKVDPEDITA